MLNAHKTRIVVWRKPSINVYKINVDGASKENPEEAGSGGLIRDYNGNFIVGFTTYLGIKSSVYAETKATWEGLKLAQQLGLASIWLESESELLVKILNGQIDPPWGISYIFDEVMNLIKGFNACLISHIYREGNSPADGLANWGIVQKRTIKFHHISELPSNIKGAITIDKLGWPNLRLK